MLAKMIEGNETTSGIRSTRRLKSYSDSKIWNRFRPGSDMETHIFLQGSTQ